MEFDLKQSIENSSGILNGPDTNPLTPAEMSSPPSEKPQIINPADVVHDQSVVTVPNDSSRVFTPSASPWASRQSEHFAYSRVQVGMFPNPDETMNYAVQNRGGEHSIMHVHYEQRGNVMTPVADYYELRGADGELRERAVKDGKNWRYERLDATHNLRVDDSLKIAGIGITEKGEILIVDKSKNIHEHMLDGDILTRDQNGRITQEVAWTGRTTDYCYAGNNGQPSSSTMRDSAGNIVEHIVFNSQSRAWNVFRPLPGEAGLDPNKLEDPTKLDAKDPIVAMQLDQFTGKRINAHADRTMSWIDLNEDHIHKLYPDGNSVVIGKDANGHAIPLMRHYPDGWNAYYTYDAAGKPRQDTFAMPVPGHPDCQYAWTLDPRDSKWKLGLMQPGKSTLLGTWNGDVTMDQKGTMIFTAPDGRTFIRDANGQTVAVNTTKQTSSTKAS